MKRGMYLAAALCLLLCGCGKKDAAEAQAVQQRYAALTGAVAEAEIVSHPEGYVLEVGEETLEDIPCLRLALDTTDADGEKVVCTVWLAEEDPVYAELSREGKLLLSVRFTAFQQTGSDDGE